MTECKFTLTTNSLKPHTARVWRVAFHPCVAVAASGSDDGTITIYNTSTTPWAQTQTLKQSAGAVYGLDFNSDGSLLASAHFNTNKVDIWRLDSSAAAGVGADGGAADGKWNCIKTLTSADSYTWGVAWSHDNTRLAVGTNSSKVYIYNTESWQIIQTLDCPCNNVWRLQWTANDDQLVCGAHSTGENMAVWNCSTWQRCQSLSGHTGNVYDVSMVESKAQDCQFLASGCINKIVQIWRRDSSSTQWELLHKLTAAGNAWGVSLSPDASVVAVATDSAKSVQIFDVQTGALLQSLSGLSNDSYSVAFSPQGDSLLSGFRDGSASVWDVSPPLGISASPIAPALHEFIPADASAVSEDIPGVAAIDNLRCCAICEHEFFVDIPDDELKAIDAAQCDLQAAVAKLTNHSHVPGCECKHETEVESIAEMIVHTDYQRRLAQSTDGGRGQRDGNALPLMLRSDRIPASMPDKPDHDHLPVLLHCGHTICRECAFQCIEPHANPRRDTLFGIAKCPVRCNRESAFVADLGVEWLPLDVSRVRLLQEHAPTLSKRARSKAAKRAPMCSEHKHTKATVYCMDPNCSQFPFMCAACDSTEHSTRSGKLHKRTPASEAHTACDTKQSVSALTCPEHKSIVIGLCPTEGAFLCEQCMPSHSSHGAFRFIDASNKCISDLGELQLDAFLKASKLSDHAASVESYFQHTLAECNAHTASLMQAVQAQHSANAAKLLCWRKVALEQSNRLARDLSSVASRVLCTRSTLHHAMERGDGKYWDAANGRGVLCV
jgi:WD40 repeat protein